MSEHVGAGEHAPITWQPSDVDIERAHVTGFLRWLRAERGVTLEGYRELWQWSVTELSDFWDAVREYYGVLGTGFDAPALVSAQMPGASWYPGARVNFAENVLKYAANAELADTAAIVEIDEADHVQAITWAELDQQVRRLAGALAALGVRQGDRVAAVLPNVHEAIVGLLASATIGATWSINSPELSAEASLNRLRQLEPSVLIGVTGYRFGGREFDCSASLAEIEAGLPSVTHTIIVDAMREGESAAGGSAASGSTQAVSAAPGSASAGTTTAHTVSRPRLDFDRLIAEHNPAPFADVPFDQPLWVLFSSGTTGAPKGIVHGHGGMLLESLKGMGLQHDQGPGDLYYVAANTSWMVWNTLVSSLATGCSVVCYAGSPTSGSPDRQFDIIARLGVTSFATGAAYLALVERSGIRPRDRFDLSGLRTMLSTGSPLPDSTWLWVHDAVRREVHLGSDSGGTDICSAFIGSNQLEPVHLGLLQGPALGVQAEAWNDAGERVTDEVGELVIVGPMPSMPLFFWGDADGAKYRAAYFERFDGVWVHGDWITETATGEFIVHGRSDATLNRGGVRLGSADVYAAMQHVPGVRDSLIIGVERPNGGYFMPLFVVLDEGVVLDEVLREEIVRTIREHASPRHVPDEIFEAPAMPVTHAGKKIEVQIKKLFMGVDPERALSLDALANPEAAQWFVDQAARFLQAD